MQDLLATLSSRVEEHSRISFFTASETRAALSKAEQGLQDLNLARSLAVAANDLDPVRRHLVLILKLDCQILNLERPDIVTESVGIQVTLRSK